VAFDRAGSIPLILVEPGYQRRGIGTGLLEAALQQLHAGSAASVTAGSGGAGHIWPGVPRDLPPAVSFFASRGWRHTHDTLDLVTDLAGYRPPPGTAGRAVRTGVTITLAAAGDLVAVRAFEAAAFPSRARWFAAARPEHVLLARDPDRVNRRNPAAGGPRCGHRVHAHARPGRWDQRLRAHLGRPGAGEERLAVLAQLIVRLAGTIGGMSPSCSRSACCSGR
jgi:GNAT superfamily N-acetyltransferase